MLQKMRVLLLVCITAVLAACQGGGDGDSTPNFAGNYQISTVNLTSNTCGGSAPPSLPAGTETVIQNGRNVSLSGDSGTVDADNGGFTVTSTDVIDGVTVAVTIKFRVTAAGASTFAV